MTKRLVALLAVLAVAFAACGKDDEKATSVSGDLNAGLKAHVENKTDEALKNYRAVLVKDPNNKFALYNIALIDQQAGRAAQAEAGYRQVIAVDPAYAPALFNLAILRTTPAPQEALELYRRAIAAKPDDPAAHLNLGFLLKSLGQTAEGDAELAKAGALDPKFAPAQPAPDASAPAPTPSTTRR